MNNFFGERKYTENEFDKLAHVTHQDLIENKKITTRRGDAKWYHVFDTDDGIHVSVKVIDVGGIQHKWVFELKHINYWFKLAPESVSNA